VLQVHSDIAQASVRRSGLPSPRGRPADQGRAHQQHAERGAQASSFISFTCFRKCLTPKIVN
jgi:hypothetical protein